MEQMNHYFKILYRNIEVIYTDSSDYRATKNEWLPGGIITAITGNIVGTMNKESIKVNKLGK